MDYQLPPVDVLAKYMCLLRRAIVQARAKAYDDGNAQIAHLLDAIENVPDLLMRWPDMDEEIVMGDLTRVEATYPEWSGRPFTEILRAGAPANWQLRWS